VNAGTQLAAINTPGDVFSAGLLGSFVLLGVFPLVAKAVADADAQAFCLEEAAHFDLVVIGASAGGWSARTSRRR
jgi:chemotaxis response regulator CheB